MGQVSIEVMFVWTRGDGRSQCGNFEVQWLTIGYEPNCRCGADCSERPCVHLLAFFMVRTSADPDFDLMWQVALVDAEFQKMAQHLRRTRGLVIDATGGDQLAVLKAAEEKMIRRAGLMRSSAPECRAEGIGHHLKEISRRAETAQRKGTAIVAPKHTHLNTLVKLSGARGNIRTQRDLESLQPCTIQVSSMILPITPTGHVNRAGGEKQPRSPSPDKMSPSNARTCNRPKKKQRIPEIPDDMSPSPTVGQHREPCSRNTTLAAARKSNVEFPIGEARIYRNWHIRRCFGLDCENQIEQNEFFVNIPLMTMNPRTAVLGYHNVGLCLRTEGRCLKHPATQIAHTMRQGKFYIPHNLPVYRRGTQSIDEQDVECITCCLGGREAYLVQP